MVVSFVLIHIVGKIKKINMLDFLYKIPYLKFNKKEIIPNGPGFYLFTYINNLFIVDQNGYEIIKFIDGKSNVKVIIDIFLRRYKNKRKKIKNDILKFILYLKKKKIIDFYK